MRFVSRGGTEPRSPQTRALNDLTTPAIHVAHRYFFNQHTLQSPDGCRCRIPRSFKLYAADFILTCGVSLRYDVDEALHIGMGVTDVAECTWCTNWQGEVYKLYAVEREASHTGVWA